MIIYLHHHDLKIALPDSEPLPVSILTTPLGNTSWKILATSNKLNGVEDEGWISNRYYLQQWLAQSSMQLIALGSSKQQQHLRRQSAMSYDTHCVFIDIIHCTFFCFNSLAK